MAPRPKPPATYALEIQALQRMVRVTNVDARISRPDWETFAKAIEQASNILSIAQSKPFPTPQ